MEVRLLLVWQLFVCFRSKVHMWSSLSVFFFEKFHKHNMTSIFKNLAPKILTCIHRPSFRPSYLQSSPSVTIPPQLFAIISIGLISAQLSAFLSIGHSSIAIICIPLHRPPFRPITFIPLPVFVPTAPDWPNER